MKRTPSADATSPHPSSVRGRSCFGRRPTPHWRETKAHEGLGELTIAEPGPDFAGVLPTSATVAIDGDAVRVADAELSRDVAHDVIKMKMAREFSRFPATGNCASISAARDGPV